MPFSIWPGIGASGRDDVDSHYAGTRASCEVIVIDVAATMDSCVEQADDAGL
jgi:hypothetical protein